MVKKKNEDSLSWKDLPKIVLTFTLVCFGYLLFRAENMVETIAYLNQIGTNDFWELKIGRVFYELFIPVLIIVILIILDLRNNVNKRKSVSSKLGTTFWLDIIMILIVIIHLFRGEANLGFIYFQF